MGYYCFTKTDLYHVYCYEMCLAWIQVILWRSMLMYKISGCSPHSKRPTISWRMAHGDFDCGIQQIVYLRQKGSATGAMQCLCVLLMPVNLFHRAIHLISELYKDSGAVVTLLLVVRGDVL